MSTHEEIIIAGFGGQGILSAGRIIAQAGMFEGKNVSWLPSYGPEMRGGTANCNVIISRDSVGSPILNSATVLIVMNNPSLQKFEKAVVPGGLIIADSSLVEEKRSRHDVKYFFIPATKIAMDMGNATYANIVMLGKLINETKIVGETFFKKALEYILPQRRHYMIPDEMKALESGKNY